MAGLALMRLRIRTHSSLINNRVSTNLMSSKSLDIPSDGPPPVGQVTSRSIPKHLRSFDKVFQVRAVIFDFSLLIRDTPIKELVPHAQLISGFDPRHERFQSSAPKHNVREWVSGLSKAELMRELGARQLSFQGDELVLKARLIQDIAAVNDKWVRGLFGREIREELKGMGIESQGKIEALHLRMNAALLEGYGTPYKHYKMALANAEKNPTPSRESATTTVISSAAASNNAKVATNVYPESQLPKELTDITTKYRKKLLAKTGGSLSSMKLSNEPSKGDAEGLVIGRKALVGASQKNNKISKWLPDSNVGDLLAYLETRSMKVCLLPDSSNKLEELETFKSHFPSIVFMKPESVAKMFEVSSNDQGKDKNIETGKDKEKEGKGSGGFLSGFFSSLTGGGKNKRSNKSTKALSKAKDVKSWRESLEYLASSELELEPGKMVVVSDKNELLQAARDLACYTVAFNPPNQRKVDVSCDFSAEQIFDVKEFIEQENGISYRK